MIIRIDENVEITIEEEQLIKSIATIKDMLAFYQVNSDVKGERAVTLIENLAVAIETMEAFWCEHFAEGGHDGKIT